MHMKPLQSSPLDEPPVEFAGKPFFAETVALLRAVRDHDFDTLATLCDDDFGIVDIAPDGSGVPIRTRAEWEAWFRDSLFPRLEQMGASTDSAITGYEALRQRRSRVRRARLSPDPDRGWVDGHVRLHRHPDLEADA